MTVLDCLTVVVTNYHRPVQLRRCLGSLPPAGICRVVVSTTAPTPEVREVINEFRDKFADLQIISTNEDFGCNENWLRGVYYARTPYVLILHDDDWLEPKFGRAFEGVIHPQLARGVGFASWRGQGVRPNGKKYAADYFEGVTRVLPSAAITQKLLLPGGSSISPVVSVFRRDDCIRILKEAAVSLNSPECFTRPTMLVGNDMLLYLRHAEKYSAWLYVDEVLTNFGAWVGSETVAASRQSVNPLTAAYDTAKKVFLATRGPQVKLPSRLIHVYSEFTPKNPTADTVRRHNYALKTWQHQYDQGNMLPLPVFDEEFSRSSKDLGDSRAQTPFIKDIVEKGLKIAMPEDRVVLTNRDTCMVRGATDVLLKWPTDAAYAVRQDVFYPVAETTAVLSDISGLGKLHCGADLFYTTPGWWQKWREWIPDMVLSYECWDLMIREICTETQPGTQVEIRNLVLHEYHETLWAQPEMRYTHPVQVYCLRNAKNFYHARGRDEHYSLAGKL